MAIRWLRELFELPEEFGGAVVTGATMANFTGLAAARGWWAERLGFDVDAAGFAGAPAAKVYAGGYLHPSAVQALGMLGLGRETVRRLAARRGRPVRPRRPGARSSRPWTGPGDRDRATPAR